MEIKPNFVILDTLSHIGMGLDFNNSKMGVVMNRAIKVKNAVQLNVGLVAHTGKDETKGIAGWNGFKANSDTVICVSNDEASGIRTWKVEKVKGRKQGETFQFSFEGKQWVQNGYFLEAPIVSYMDTGTKSLQPLTCSQKTLLAICNHKSKTQTELIAILNEKFPNNTSFAKTHISKYCSSLVTDEMIELVEGTKKYNITKKGIKEALKLDGIANPEEYLNCVESL